MNKSAVRLENESIPYLGTRCQPVKRCRHKNTLAISLHGREMATARRCNYKLLGGLPRRKPRRWCCNTARALNARISMLRQAPWFVIGLKRIGERMICNDHYYITPFDLLDRECRVLVQAVGSGLGDRAAVLRSVPQTGGLRWLPLPSRLPEQPHSAARLDSAMVGRILRSRQFALCWGQSQNSESNKRRRGRLPLQKGAAR